MPAGRSAARRLATFAIGIGLSLAFLYATFRTVPLAELFETLGRARPSWIVAALLFTGLAYLLKIARWLAMLRSLGATIGFARAAPPYLGAVALNNVLPLRAGDVVRVVAFQRFTGISATGQLGVLTLERLLDLLVLSALLFATLFMAQVQVGDDTLLAGLQFVAAGAVAAVLLFILAPMPIRWIVRMMERHVPRLEAAGDAILRLSAAVATLSKAPLLARAGALSLCAWLAEGGAYYAVGQALGVGASISAAMLALSIATLATMIPSSPGYVGTFHYFAARAVVMTGGAPVAAAAYAVLIHGLLWLATTSAGFMALAVSGAGRVRDQGREPH